MQKLKNFLRENLKTSTKLNIVSLALLAMTLTCGFTIRNFLRLLQEPDQPIFYSMVFFILVGYYAMLTLVFGALLATITKRRICEYRQGWLEDPVAANHGKTLAEVIEGLRNEPVEYIAYFSPSGEKLAEATQLRPDQVCLTREQRRLVKQHPGCISIHNHPDHYISAFSTADVAVGVRIQESQSIVVAENICFVLQGLGDVNAQPSEVTDAMQNTPTANYLAMLVSNQTLFNYLMQDRLDELSLMRCANAAEKFGIKFEVKPTDTLVANYCANSNNHVTATADDMTDTEETEETEEEEMSNLVTKMLTQCIDEIFKTAEK